MLKAIPVDVYDKDGNLTKIEFTDQSGDHIIDAVWDSTDEQSSENRINFREWAYKWIEQKGYKVQK
jgi:hypothetical protein